MDASRALVWVSLGRCHGAGVGRIKQQREHVLSALRLGDSSRPSLGELLIRGRENRVGDPVLAKRALRAAATKAATRTIQNARSIGLGRGVLRRAT